MAADNTSKYAGLSAPGITSVSHPQQSSTPESAMDAPGEKGKKGKKKRRR